MAFISRLAAQCFLWGNSNYKALSKKDDDFGVEEARDWVKAWLETYPVGYIKENIRYSNLKKVNAYANEVIKSLKKVTITSSNASIIKACLVGMAEESALVRQALVRK